MPQTIFGSVRFKSFQNEIEDDKKTLEANLQSTSPLRWEVRSLKSELESILPNFFFSAFFFFGVKLGHFTIHTFFLYVTKIQAYQQKTEKFFVSEEKKFGRIDSWTWPGRTLAYILIHSSIGGIDEPDRPIRLGFSG